MVLSSISTIQIRFNIIHIDWVTFPDKAIENFKREGDCGQINVISLLNLLISKINWVSDKYDVVDVILRSVFLES